MQGALPETAYVDALLLNLEHQLPFVQGRTIQSVFMGGGTPSLFSAKALDRLLKGIRARLPLATTIEITLEANPGTVESRRFTEYYEIGINRLSLGIQSFNQKHLSLLGRVHTHHEAQRAIEIVQLAGFSNFNIDLMFGLPEQSLQEGLNDLQCALSYQPTHLSWYELTIEPNTYFWHFPPTVPKKENVATLQEQGQALLSAHQYQQYEISAYTRNTLCQHNLNYWEFGDYLAIGAGSHAKITLPSTPGELNILRLQHYRSPKAYLNCLSSFVQETVHLPPSQLPFEFMLNALRLKAGVPATLFTQRTGLPLENILLTLQKAQKKGLLAPSLDSLCATPLGYRFLNDLIMLFLA